MKARRFLALCWTSLACAAPAADRLDLRDGAWEMTATTRVSEVQADAGAGFDAEPQVETTLECVAAQDFELPIKAPEIAGCTQTIVRATRTLHEARLACAGEPPASGLLRVEARNPTTLAARIELRAGEGSEAWALESQIQGRWIAAQCEDEDAPEEDEEDLSDPGEYDEPEE